MLRETQWRKKKNVPSLNGLVIERAMCRSGIYVVNRLLHTWKFPALSNKYSGQLFTGEKISVSSNLICFRTEKRGSKLWQTIWLSFAWSIPHPSSSHPMSSDASTTSAGWWQEAPIVEQVSALDCRIWGELISLKEAVASKKSQQLWMGNRRRRLARKMRENVNGHLGHLAGRGLYSLA